MKQLAFRYFQTIRHLRPKQIWYQIYYRITKRSFKDVKAPEGWATPQGTFNFLPYPRSLTISKDGVRFNFLNLDVLFENEIDWNYSVNGKLWTYYLNYMDFLNEDGLPDNDKEMMIDSYISKRFIIQDGMDAYVLSLRGFNLIKYSLRTSKHTYDDFIFSQYTLLRKKLEFHLSGNHLLENAISMTAAGLYFRNDNWFSLGSTLLTQELDEQIYDDGGHFEGSPMYQTILIGRLAELFEMVVSSGNHNANLQLFIKSYLQRMLGWLMAIRFKCGELPWVNDGSPSMLVATPEVIQNYIESLGIYADLTPLSDSGYRKISLGSFELFMKVGKIGADYIPGHAHADSLHFLLYYNSLPLLVDTGTSTYASGMIRDRERSTQLHNTVVVAGMNSSDVWGAFRVGRRAETRIIHESENSVTAEHDGYKNLGVIHSRTWVQTEEKLSIKDQIRGDAKNPVQAFFHLHEMWNAKIELGDRNAIVGNYVFLFNSPNDLNISSRIYKRALSFNKVVDAWVIIVSFKTTLETEIICS